MALSYDFTLTDGTNLTTVYALEGNGPDNLSTPRQILDINFDTALPFIVVDGDVTHRFINAFDFTIMGGSSYDGTYKVAGTSTTVTYPTGRTVTHIPLIAPPIPAGFSIIEATSGLGGSLVITGPVNGSKIFYSNFTVSGNPLSAANGNYTVNSVFTGNEFKVDSITVGNNGTFFVSGDQRSFIRPNANIRVNNVEYTVTSISYNVGNTEVTVLNIPVETIVNTNTFLSVTIPNTKIVVNEIIPTGTGAGGTAQPAAPTVIKFTTLSPVVVTPTTAHNYKILFRVQGDQTTKFTPQSSFYPVNVSYNNAPYATAFVVTSSSHITTNDTTEVVVDITDDSPITPVIHTNDTRGYQDINFVSFATGADATGLVPATTYTSTITVDGTPISISVLGSSAQTVNELITQINTGLEALAIVRLDIPNKKLTITSATTGPTSTIDITAGTLFHSPLINFVNIGTAVTGSMKSWILYPVPVIPYGSVQYTVPTVDTSLQLLGPGSPNYNSITSWGKLLQNNDIHLLENFNKSTAPISPIAGQLWFDPIVPRMSTYDGVVWDSLVSTVWPVQDYIDMNSHKIVGVADANTALPYVVSSTTKGNNDQEAMNLRTSDLMYIAKTGGNSATPSVRSGTMTGSLNMNGVSPGGASAIGINVNSAPISQYGTSTLDFKTGGTGGINFEANTSGNINIQGTGNVVVMNGNLTVGSGTNKVIIQNNTGATPAPTITFTTSTTNNSVINLANNKIVNMISPIDPLDAANKAYVDSLVNGIIWLQPVKDPNLFDDSLSAPPTVTGDSNAQYHRTYIVKSPGTGAWAGLSNRAVVYDSQSAAWVDILGRNVAIGDRFGVFCEPYENDPLTTLPGGGLATKAGKIVTVTAVAPYTYADYTPTEPDAFSVTGSNPTINALTNSYDKSPHFGHSYTFRGTWGTGGFGIGYKWIEFSGPQMLVDGAGLKYLGNVLNIGTGFGITVNADTVQVNQPDLDTFYLRRDGTVSMLGVLNLNSFRISDLANPTIATDAVNMQYADGKYVQLAGSTMALNANITFNGGQILGLPSVPTGATAATSKTYVDNQDNLRLLLAGGNMNTNASVTFSGTGEVLGLPTIPTTIGSATSKSYVDTQLALKSNDTTVVHLAGTETITGAKTFSAATTHSDTINVTTGANINLSGGTGELLGLPATPSGDTAAASKKYVDTKATDILAVHLAGTETITGAKTFSAATIHNGSVSIAANGVFTNLTASTTGFTVLGTSVSSGGAYAISLTSGQNTAGIGGALSLTAGAGSTIGGGISITGGQGTTTTGGNIVITSGTGPTTITNGSISLVAGSAALLLDPQGVWKINNVTPSAANQAIVSNATNPATAAPSWQTIGRRVAAAPATSASAGNAGDWYSDNTYLYTYSGTAWRRVAVSAF